MMGSVYEEVFGSSDRAVEGPICRLFDRAVGVHQTEKVGGRWSRGLLCIAFQRLFQSSVTRLGLHLIRSGGHSPRVFQTLHNLSDTVSWTITMLSPSKAFKKKRIYRSTLSFSFHPSSSIFHATISQILLCNKAEIKRLAGQLK